jgi:hypothetical protein
VYVRRLPSTRLCEPRALNGDAIDSAAFKRALAVTLEQLRQWLVAHVLNKRSPGCPGLAGDRTNVRTRAASFGTEAGSILLG